MINQELVSFIKMELLKGSNKETITNKLLSGGWDVEDIKEGFNEIGLSKETLTEDKPLSEEKAVDQTVAQPETTPQSQVQKVDLGLTSTFQIRSTVDKKKKSYLSGKVILAIFILLLLAGGAFAYSFKEDLLKLPIVKILIQTDNKTETPEAPVNSNEESLSSQTVEDIQNKENPQEMVPEKNFCISATGKVMTYQRAQEIAMSSSCAKVGEFTMKYGCNDNSGGLINVGMNPLNNPGCGFACRISIDTEEAEEGWMCTGLIPANGDLMEQIPAIPEKI